MTCRDKLPRRLTASLIGLVSFINSGCSSFLSSKIEYDGKPAITDAVAVECIRTTANLLVVDNPNNPYRLAEAFNGYIGIGDIEKAYETAKKTTSLDINRGIEMFRTLETYKEKNSKQGERH